MTKRKSGFQWSILLIVILGLVTACASVPPAPNQGIEEAPVLIWYREGGIAGLCNGLNVYADGRVKVTSCTGELVYEGVLSPEQKAQLDAWASRLAPFEVEWADAGVADSMTVLIKFWSGGQDSASEDEMQAIGTYASQVYASMDSGNYAIDSAQDKLLWEDAVALILDGQVEQVVQTHALEVTLILKDGTVQNTVEPAIDEVFAVIDRCGGPCAEMVLATE